MKKIILFAILALSPVFAASSSDCPSETRGFLTKSLRDTMQTSGQALTFAAKDPAGAASLVTSFVPLIFVGAMGAADSFTACMAWAAGVFLCFTLSYASEKHAKTKAGWYTGTLNLARLTDCILAIIVLTGQYASATSLD